MQWHKLKCMHNFDYLKDDVGCIQEDIDYIQYDINNLYDDINYM